MTRTKAVLLASFLLAAILPAPAQLQNSASPSSSNTGDQQSTVPTTVPPQALSLDQFNGSGTVDKLIPGVIKLSLPDAMDRGLKHNLGLILSQEQTGSAR